MFLVTFCNPCCNKRYYVHICTYMQYLKNKSDGKLAIAGLFLSLCDIYIYGFMYSADADIFIIFFFFFFAFFCWHTLERDPESDRLGHPPPPPRIMILWRSIESTTQIAQLRWRNVANVGMVAVGTTTLAQRRHGRRRHNYGGATSFSQRWAKVFLPTICQRCRPCWKK